MYHLNPHIAPCLTITGHLNPHIAPCLTITGQGLGQNLTVGGNTAPTNPEARAADDSDDEVEGMFGGLQAAVISMHMDMNDSEHESESDVEDEAAYEFCSKTRRVQRKQAQ